MSWIGYAIFGLVAGALARLIHPGKDPMNWLWTMLLGIAGAMLGGWIGSNVFGVSTQSGLMSWIAAIGGAILLLAAFDFFSRKTAATTATNDDYKKAVFDDLKRGPNG